MEISAKSLGMWWTLPLLVASAVMAADLRLVEAAKSGDKEAVRSLLKQHVDVNAPQADGATALSWAAYRDDLERAIKDVEHAIKLEPKNASLLADRAGVFENFKKLDKAEADLNEFVKREAKDVYALVQRCNFYIRHDRNKLTSACSSRRVSDGLAHVSAAA